MRISIFKKHKLYSVLPFLPAILLVFSCQGGKMSPSAPVRKVLIILSDGIPADVIEHVYTPWIDSIAAEGGYTRAYTGGEAGEYSESPTISAVCYASLLTGTWANKHNVWDNDINAPNYHYPTVFRFFKDQYPDKKIGIYSTWLDNRTKLLGEGKEATGYIKVDFHEDGYELDTVKFPHDSMSLYIHRIDELVSEKAAESLRNDAPDLSWVYLQYTDDIGHRFGDSPQMDSSVTIADRQIGRLWQAVQYRQANFNEEWLVYVVTDHGRDSGGYHHGGQTERERGIWIATNDKKLNSCFYESQPGMVDVLPTILRFMNIEIPRESNIELDGIPLSGEISHIFKSAKVQDNKLFLEWDAIKDEGNLKVWLSRSNDYSVGGHDVYLDIAKVPLSAGKAILDISRYPSDFYKVVLESSDQITNKWVVMGKL